MGTSQSAVARLESGDADVRLSTLERYAAAIGQRLDFRAATEDLMSFINPGADDPVRHLRAATRRRWCAPSSGSRRVVALTGTLDDVASMTVAAELMAPRR